MIARLCACPCRKPIPAGARATRKYHDPTRCRQRAYRARVREAAARAGVAPTITLSAVRAGTGDRHRYAKRPAGTRKPDQRVSVRKAEDAIRRELGDPAAANAAIAAMRSALPPGARHAA